MFVVRPIQNKDEQKMICSVLNTPYYENALAFYAADLKDDNTNIDEYISICQFYLSGEAEIVGFHAADGREEDEAVIVMLRAAMSFMQRCGAGYARFLEGAASEFWMKKSGFPQNNGIYRIDLDLFYSSPCKFSEDNT